MTRTTINLPAASSPAIEENHQGKPPQVETAKVGRRFWILALLRRHIPTLMVMAVLAGLGVYGHHSDWKLPKFSALTGSGVGRAGRLVRRTWRAGIAVRRMSPGPAAPRQGLRLVQGARRSRTARCAIPRSRN